MGTVRECARGQLAGYKLPDRIELVAELPLTPAEKLDRRALTAAVASTVHPQVGR